MRLFFLVYFALLILVLTFIGAMGYLGCELIQTSAKFMLFGLLTGSALVAATWWVTRRISLPWLKIAAGLLLSLFTMAVILAMYLAFTVILYTQTPIHYATLTSPGGESAAVMYHLDAEEALMAAADGDPAQPDRHYTAYPVRMGFFYYIEGAAEGEIIMAADSEARLMHEWTDEDTLRMYLENPGDGEGGELILNLN